MLLWFRDSDRAVIFTLVLLLVLGLLFPYLKSAVRNYILFSGGGYPKGNGKEICLNECSVVIPEMKLESETDLDLNQATKRELMELTGIGEVLAQAIVDYRTSRGPFSSVEELVQVEGIGDHLLSELRSELEVSGS